MNVQLDDNTDGSINSSQSKVWIRNSLSVSLTVSGTVSLTVCLTMSLSESVCVSDCESVYQSD